MGCSGLAGFVGSAASFAGGTGDADATGVGLSEVSGAPGEMAAGATGAAFVSGVGADDVFAASVGAAAGLAGALTVPESGGALAAGDDAVTGALAAAPGIGVVAGAPFSSFCAATGVLADPGAASTLPVSVEVAWAGMGFAPSGALDTAADWIGCYKTAFFLSLAGVFDFLVMLILLSWL